MASNDQKVLRPKTVEDLDLSKYQEGTGESEDLHKKHLVKNRSHFAVSPHGEEADSLPSKRQVSFRDLGVQLIEDVFENEQTDSPIKLIYQTSSFHLQTQRRRADQRP